MTKKHTGKGDFRKFDERLKSSILEEEKKLLGRFSSVCGLIPANELGILNMFSLSGENRYDNGNLMVCCSTISTHNRFQISIIVQSN